ncbi:MAG: transposase [Phycisphaeraceae bacterium]|nr:transposase [Phycisphaeraceae bacterium]
MKRFELPGGVRFITFSCQRRLPLLSNPSIRRIMVDSIAQARTSHGFELFAWVLMPEHVHLLIRPHQDTPLDRPLKSIKLAVAKAAIRRWRDLGANRLLTNIDDGRGTPRFWQKGGGFDRNVRDAAEFCREVRYIHRNPVERGLVTAPELWTWSSVHWWMGHRGDELPCDPPPGRPDSWARWMGFR